jgi:hypothetical protein
MNERTSGTDGADTRFEKKVLGEEEIRRNEPEMKLLQAARVNVALIAVTWELGNLLGGVGRQTLYCTQLLQLYRGMKRNDVEWGAE